MQFQAPADPFRARVCPPGDKSLSHRALILAAMAAGESRIGGLGPGADVMFGRFGLTGELGYMAAFEFPSNGFGTFSPGVLYAFAKRGTVPFLNGGFTLFFRGGAEAGWFVGGGLNFWRSDRFGFRAELNDQVLFSSHLLTARFAILFR